MLIRSGHELLRRWLGGGITAKRTIFLPVRFRVVLTWNRFPKGSASWKSPAMVCLDCVTESGVKEVAALARGYAQAAAASRSVLGANATGLSLQRDKKVVYPFVLPIKNFS